MTSPKQRAIAAEWGEPFWDVVKGFADQGESIPGTAGILGYNVQAFRRLVHRYGNAHWFKAGQDSVGAIAARESRKGKPASGAMIAALEKASSVNPTYRRVDLDGITDTLAGHARRRGVSVRTVYKRLKRGLPLDEAFTKSKLYTTRRVSCSHPWKSY